MRRPLTTPIKLGKETFIPGNRDDVKRFLDLVDHLRETNGQIHLASVKESRKTVPINSAEGIQAVIRAQFLIVERQPIERVERVMGEPLRNNQEIEEKSSESEQKHPAKPIAQKNKAKTPQRSETGIVSNGKTVPST